MTVATRNHGSNRLRQSHHGRGRLRQNPTNGSWWFFRSFLHSRQAKRESHQR